MLVGAHKVINKKAWFVNNFLPSELFSVENELVIHLFGSRQMMAFREVFCKFVFP